METKNIEKNYNEIVKVVSHNHVKSLFDAVEPPENMFNAFLNAGYTSIGITDHGSFTAMQKMIDLANDYNKENPDKDQIKILYGCEVYVQMPTENDLPHFEISERVAHLIIYAVDETGKHALDKLNSKAKGRRFGSPVILWDDLKTGVAAVKGSLIATSACITGIPSIYLRVNDFLCDKINNIEEKRENETLKAEDDINEVTFKYIKPDNILYIDAKKEFDEQNDKINNLSNEISDPITKDGLKLMKADLRKAKKMGDEKIQKDLEDKISKIEKHLIILKDNLKKARDEMKEIKKKYKFFKEKVDAWLKINEEIDTLNARKESQVQQIENAKKGILYLDNIFGHGNFYVEVQNHGMDKEKEIYPILAQIAKNNDIKIIAANDAHMAYNNQKSLDMRNVARFLRFIKIDEQPQDKEMYVKTPNELASALANILSLEQVDEAMMNLNELNEKISYIPKKVPHYPIFDKNQDSKELLRKTARKNIEWRYPNGEGWDEEHEERLNYELDVICSMGYADYHLIVADFLEYARICGKVPVERLSEVPLTIEGAKKFVADNNYTIGVGIGIGRGSGVGSITTYLLGITDIDPIKFGLVFERFLNPERITMPDIDSDFAIGVREKTIDYVRNKFGNEAVVGIITETREGVKGAIRDAARYLGKKETDNDKAYLSLGNTIRKKVPASPGITFDSNFSDKSDITIYDSLLSDFAKNDTAKRILMIAKNIEGMLCAYGQHAAGVIIYDGDDITDYIPTREGKLGPTTECDMIQAEAIKLLKMDFLGLKTLSVLTTTARMIKENRGIEINIDNISLEGPEAQLVYQDIFAKGRTKNVFQFESPGMRKYLKELMSK